MKPTLPPTIPLCAAQQLAMRLSAPRRNTAMKKRTAELLVKLDRFEEALSEYQSIDSDERDWEMKFQIAKIHKAIGGTDNNETARKQLSSILFDLDAAQNSAVLTELGDIYRKAGELDKARDYFLKALSNNPGDNYALRKYSVTQFDSGRVSDLLRYCEALIADGINHTRLTATYFTALAALGRLKDAKAIRGLEEFFWQGMLAPPDNFDTIEAFNQKLIAELRANPSLRFENSQSASENSWRIEQPRLGKANHVSTLLQSIAAQVDIYTQHLANTNSDTSQQFFTARTPASAHIRAWSIITRETGFENWHIHDAGWLSGVYYAAVPSSPSGKNDKAGAIEFGWTERLLGAGASEKYGNAIIHPKPGMLLLFPSHMHHRTWPHGMPEDRIVFSFDIVPTKPQASTLDHLQCLKV